MLIMTSLTPFGQTGPYRDYKAYELNLYQGCGYGYISTVCYREPVNNPIKAGGRQTQFGLALVGAVATVSAVLARTKIGAGQHVDVAGLEVMAGLYESAIQHWTFAQNVLGGVSNPILQPMVALECKNGYIYIQCLEDAQFNNFVKVMGEPEWTKNELFKDRFSRAVYIDALIPLLQDWTLQRTKDEIFTLAQEAHVPVAPAYTSAEVINSPQLAARKYLVEIDHPVMGTCAFRRAVPALRHPLAHKPARPLLGEHNTDIYCKDLGRSLQDLVKLAQGGAI
jgi:crotonobetainyl-CoA:carnitine CoA-transferase CaiB-like acyl-CoA transferase